MAETDFKKYVEEVHARITARRFDHFELLGLPKSATFQDIEKAYRRLSARFSDENIAGLGESEAAIKARYLVDRIDHAYEVLTNYSKREDYEKRGFREAHEVEKIEQPPDIARGIYQKAKVLYAQKQYRMCMDALDKAIKLDERAEYFQLLGLCQMNIPSLRRKAEENLLKAAEIEPWNAEHFYALGMLFYSEKLPRRAVGYFRKAVYLEPGHVQAKKKVEEIEGPQLSGWQKLMQGVGDALRKALPSLFRRK